MRIIAPGDPVWLCRIKVVLVAPLLYIIAPFVIIWEGRDEFCDVAKEIKQVWVYGHSGAGRKYEEEARKCR